MNAAAVGDFCRSVAQAGAALFVQTALVLLLGLGVGWALRRRGAQVQSLACRATLMAVLLAALLSPVLVPGRRALWRVSLSPAAPIPAAPPAVAVAPPTGDLGPIPKPALGPVPRHAAGGAVPAVAPFVRPVPAPVRASATRGADGVYVWMVGVWLAGTTALLAWLGLGAASLAVLRRGSVAVGGEAADLLRHLCAARGVRPPRLLASARVRGPFLAGLWRPCVFLPASYAVDFDANALRAILAHELAHWERRDNAWLLLSRVLCAVFWPQPLLWALSRRLGQSSEEACDDWALAQGCSPRDYADCLLSLAARRPFSLGERAVGVGIVSVRSAVGRRIQAVLNRKDQTMPVVSSRLRLAVLLGAVAAALGAAFLVAPSVPAQAPTPTPPAAPTIVGTWRVEGSTPNGKPETLTFRSNGTLIDANSSPLSKGVTYVVRTFGPYTVTGDSLTIHLTSREDKSGRVQPLNPPIKGVVDFRLTGDSLTTTLSNGDVIHMRRVMDTAADVPAPDVDRIGDILADNTPVWAERAAGGRLLSRLSKGQAVAIRARRRAIMPS